MVPEGSEAIVERNVRPIHPGAWPGEPKESLLGMGAGASPMNGASMPAARGREPGRRLRIMIRNFRRGGAPRTIPVYRRIRRP